MGSPRKYRISLTATPVSNMGQALFEITALITRETNHVNGVLPFYVKHYKIRFCCIAPDNMMPFDQLTLPDMTGMTPQNGAESDGWYACLLIEADKK